MYNRNYSHIIKQAGETRSQQIERKKRLMKLLGIEERPEESEKMRWREAMMNRAPRAKEKSEKTDDLER